MTVGNGALPPQDPDAPRALEAEALTYRYGSRVALEEASFTVGKGEIFGLLGPNGSGKTTLFRLLSTLLPPQAGRARIFGHDLARETLAVRRRIGVVFQSPSLDKKLTVAENLRHQGHLYGLGGQELARRSGEMLARVGLSDRAGERVEKLSGGQRRRVELAKGLLHRPDLLLLDEPSTGLDPAARRDLMGHLKDLSAREGVTSLLTTHLMEEAEGCSRLAFLNQGRFVALDTPGALKSRIGGDVITVEVKDPDLFSRDLGERLNVTSTVLDGKVRIERLDGPRFVAQMAEAFPGRFESVSVGKPTLEDVFVHTTGHRFFEHSEESSGALDDRKERKK